MRGAAVVLVTSIVGSCGGTVAPDPTTATQTIVAAPTAAVAVARPSGGESPRAAPASPGLPHGTRVSIETIASPEDVSDIQAGIAMAAWYLRERVGPDRPRTVTVNITSTPYRGDMRPGMAPAESICCWSQATRNGTGLISFNLAAAEWDQRFPYDTRVWHRKSAAHEYGHTWMGDIGCLQYGRPAWMQEGIVEFMATQAVLEFGLVSEARVNAHLASVRSASLQLPLKDLELAMPVEANPYTVAHLAVRRLMTTNAKPPALRRWCELVADGLSWQDAFLSAFGLSVPDFYRQFEEFRMTL